MKKRRQGQDSTPKILTLDQEVIADLEALDDAESVVGASKPTVTIQSGFSLSNSTGY